MVIKRFEVNAHKPVVLTISLTDQDLVIGYLCFVCHNRKLHSDTLLNKFRKSVSGFFYFTYFIIGINYGVKRDIVAVDGAYRIKCKEFDHDLCYGRTGRCSLGGKHDLVTLCSTRNESVLYRPLYGIGSPAAYGICIGIRGNIGLFAYGDIHALILGVLHEHKCKLLACNGILGPERAVCYTRGNSLFVCPFDGCHIPASVTDIRKARCRILIRIKAFIACGKNGNEHGSVHTDTCTEGGFGISLEQSVFVTDTDGIVIPRAALNVGEGIFVPPLCACAYSQRTAEYYNEHNCSNKA